MAALVVVSLLLGYYLLKRRFKFGPKKGFLISLEFFGLLVVLIVAMRLIGIPSGF